MHYHHHINTKAPYYYEIQEESSSEYSEGITNKSNSCWMISVIQALRASALFQKLYQPKHSETNAVKKELFHLFDIVDGKHGQGKRKVRLEETLAFRELVMREGLPVKMNRGYYETPFLNFLLKKIQATLFTYKERYQVKHAHVLILSPSFDSLLSDLIQSRTISFKDRASTPKILPIALDRKHPIPIVPTTAIEIPVGTNQKAIYDLVSICIGRDDINHAYTYEVRLFCEGVPVWIEYNDAKVITHSNPFTQRRKSLSSKTPFDDACFYAQFFIFELRTVT